jgi:hypothetical protein
VDDRGHVAPHAPPELTPTYSQAGWSDDVIVPPAVCPRRTAPPPSTAVQGLSTAQRARSSRSRLRAASVDGPTGAVPCPAWRGRLGERPHLPVATSCKRGSDSSLPPDSRGRFYGAMTRTEVCRAISPRGNATSRILTMMALVKLAKDGQAPWTAHRSPRGLPGRAGAVRCLDEQTALEAIDVGQRNVVQPTSRCLHRPRGNVGAWRQGLLGRCPEDGPGSRPNRL